MITKDNIIKPRTDYSSDELKYMKNYIFEEDIVTHSVKMEVDTVVNDYQKNVYSSVLEKSFYNVFCTDMFLDVDRVQFIRKLSKNYIDIPYKIYPWFEYIVKKYNPLVHIIKIQ